MSTDPKLPNGAEVKWNMPVPESVSGIGKPDCATIPLTELVSVITTEIPACVGVAIPNATSPSTAAKHASRRLNLINIELSPNCEMPWASHPWPLFAGPVHRFETIHNENAHELSIQKPRPIGGS